MNNMPYEYKKVWIKRDDNTLEYKEWFIFSFKIENDTKVKINNFINHEILRYNKKNENIFDNVKKEDFYNIDTTNRYIPPRIIKLPKDTATSFGFSLVKDINNFTFGDNVGGILQEEYLTNNTYLQRELINYDYILFNPGIIAKLHFYAKENDYYLYQLDQKNLFHKNRVYYTAFGGHIKYNTERLKPYLIKYNIICKQREGDSNNDDLSFLIPTKYFNEFITIFQKDILTKQFNLFENPSITIQRELFEELGPISAIDGINLLTNQEMITLFQNNHKCQ